jgi:hypothetical protein
MQVIILEILKTFLTKKLLKALIIGLAEWAVDETTTKADNKFLEIVKKAMEAT